MPILGAILAGTMGFSRKEVDVDEMKRDLTIKYRDQIADEQVTIHGYSETERTLFVPREYGIAHCQSNGKGWHDKTAEGTSGLWENASAISLRDYQTPWVEGILSSLQTEYDIRAQAGTAMGKTVMSLEVARRLDTTTLVVVDQEFLRDQWIETATRSDLFNLPRDQIGIVQGSKCEYEGKTIVVAMIQTLFKRKFDQEFLDYFGAVVFDECHTVGAPVFAKTMGMFTAQARWGVSATPDRGDKKDQLILWHLGAVEVSLEKKHRKSTIRFVESHGVCSWYAVTSPKTGRYLNEIAEDTSRNRLMADCMSDLYESGRTILALSDRIEHLEVMRYLLVQNGVPFEDIGIVARYSRNWRYAKDPEPKAVPTEWERETEYTPVKLQVVSKKVKSDILDSLKESRGILLATYSMFSKGVDVPRLDTGIDLTPRSKAQQQHGRILRSMSGKMTPLWVTMRDVNISRAEFQFVKRLYEYIKSNVEVYEWRRDLGVRKRDHKQLIREARSRSELLKGVRIITTPDGRSMLQTPSLQKRPANNPGNTTGKRTRKRKAN